MVLAEAWDLLAILPGLCKRTAQMQDFLIE